jgi:hypothetical protein
VISMRCAGRSYRQGPTIDPFLKSLAAHSFVVVSSKFNSLGDSLLMWRHIWTQGAASRRAWYLRAVLQACDRKLATAIAKNELRSMD